MPSAQHAERDNVTELYDGVVDRSTDWPLIAPGEYTARYVRHVGVEMRMYRNSPRVYIHLRILDPGEHYGVTLYRAYRVRYIRRLTEAPGTPSIGCAFAVGRRSELLRMYAHVMDVQARPDRISLRALKQHVLRIRVRTVSHDSRQRPLPECLRYSVVDDILGRETGE